MGELFAHTMVVASSFDPAVTSGDGSADDPFVVGTDPFGDSADPFVNSSPGGAISGILVIIVVILVIGVGVAIYRAVKLAQQGKNPLTLDNDIQAAALDVLQKHNSSTAGSPGGAAGVGAPAAGDPGGTPPASTREQRLGEIDDLCARGIISESEQAAARAAILAS